MLSTSQEGRGCPAGHRGREAQGERHAGRARVRPSSRPEAVEGVAVVCCCSSVDLVAVGSRVGGCCGCLNGGEVVVGGGAAALFLMCWRGGRHGSRAKEEQGKGRKGKKRRKEQRGKGIKKRLGRVLVCVRVLHLIYNRLKQIILIKKQKIICFYLVI